MAHAHHTPRLARTEEAVTVLFLPRRRRLRRRPQPEGANLRVAQEALGLGGADPRPAPALLQQLRGVESERSFLRDAEQRFLARVFPGAWSGSPPPRCTAACAQAPALLGAALRRAPCRRSWSATRKTLIADSALLSVPHPRQVGRSAAGFEGTAWARWGSFAVHGVKLRLLCATNRVPLSYELTAANAAEVRLVEELLDEVLDEARDWGTGRRGGCSATSPTAAAS